MTKQEEIVLIGGVGFLAAKFYFKQSLIMSAVIGLATIAAYSILTATNE